MIKQLDSNQLEIAATIHSISWKESHKSFCSKEFIELHSIEHQKEYFRHELEQGKKLYMIEEEEPVGIVTVYGDLIENLYVLPEKQKMGYGTKLLLFAIEQCKGTPTLWILDNNKVAYHFYLKYGFTLTGERKLITTGLYEVEMNKMKKAN